MLVATHWIKMGLLLVVMFVNVQGLAVLTVFHHSTQIAFPAEEERDTSDLSSEMEELLLCRSTARQQRVIVGEFGRDQRFGSQTRKQHRPSRQAIRAVTHTRWRMLC